MFPMTRGAKYRAVSMLVLFVCGAGCGPRSPQASKSAASADPSARESHKTEFYAIAEKVEQSSNFYLGHAQVEELRFQLQVTTAENAEGRRVRGDFAKELLRIGEIEEAVGVMNETIAALEADPARRETESDLYMIRALAHLRAAEIANCVDRHNRDCCIFPLQGGGIHAVSEPARLAKQDYLRYLESPRHPAAGAEAQALEANRITARWLLGVACMALDEPPTSVPAAYRMPAAAMSAGSGIARFSDVASAVGIAGFDHAGGAIADDLDGDGYFDLVSSTCNLRGPMTAYRNRGDGTFEDVAAAWRLDDQTGTLHVAGADYDNDGDVDIIVPRGAWMHEEGRIRKSLLRNDGAQGFTDVTRAAGVEGMPGPSQAVVWADFDNDGLLDLYFCHESRIETAKSAMNHLCEMYRNQGDGTFTNVANTAGVTNSRFAKGVAAGDYDNDGDMDIYISNIGANRLYRNDGGMRFVDVAPELGVVDPPGRSFACWFFDYDNDGDLDLWVNAYGAQVSDVLLSAQGKPHHASPMCLYRNEGDGTFTNATKETGLDRAWLPMGCSFGDFDNDGWLDVYLGTGDPMYDSIQPNVALRNDRGRRFVDVTGASGLGHLQKGHGVVFADVDDDGDQDVFHQLGGFFPGDAFANALFENPGNGNHFVKVELVGTKSNRQGIGARIEVELATPQGARSLHHAVGCVSSFGQAPRRQEIGLGDATKIVSIEIDWPASGTHQSLTGVPLDSSIRVTEGENGFETLQLHPVKLGGGAAGA